MQNGWLLENEQARLLLGALAKETARLSRPPMWVESPTRSEVAETVARNTASNRNSMLQDLERGAATDVEAINGAVVQAAVQAGLEAPFNEIMRRRVHGLVAKQEIV